MLGKSIIMVLAEVNGKPVVWSARIWKDYLVLPITFKKVETSSMKLDCVCEVVQSFRLENFDDKLSFEVHFLTQNKNKI